MKVIRSLILAAFVLAPIMSARSQGISNDSMEGASGIAAYDSIVVGEFRDSATVNTRFRGDSPQQIDDARAAYAADLSVALENFQKLLIQEIQRTNVYSEVVPTGALIAGRALLIDGEVTQFDRGNLTTRILVGMGAGRVQFDATVRIRDASTGAELRTIDIGRGSGILGGAVGSALTVEYYMLRSAMSVAAQLREQRCALIVCEEPPPLTIPASKDADSVAKEFDVGSDECRIYFYVSLPRNTDSRAGVEVWVDDADEGMLNSEDGYFLWSLEPGNHRVETRYLSASLRRPAEVTCTGGDAIFVHHDVEGLMVERLLLESESHGQRDVRRRQLFIRGQ